MKSLLPLPWVNPNIYLVNFVLLRKNKKKKKKNRFEWSKHELFTLLKLIWKKQKVKIKRNDERKGIITRRIGFAYGGRIFEDHYQRREQAYLE